MPLKNRTVTARSTAMSVLFLLLVAIAIIDALLPQRLLQHAAWRRQTAVSWHLSLYLHYPSPHRIALSDISSSSRSTRGVCAIAV